MVRDFLIRNKYKIIFSILIIVGILFIMYMYMVYFTNKEDIILKKDLTTTFREDSNVMDFIESINGKIVSNTKIDTNYVGIKKVSFSYVNRYGFIVSKKFEIEIKDVVKPTIEVSNTLVIEKGSTIDLFDIIMCADDYDDNVSCKIKGDYDLNKAGEYKLKIIARDNSGNTTNKDFTLKVKEKIGNNNNDKDENLESMSYTNFTEVYKKYKNNNTMIGLDLSKWQKEVDFSKLKKQGVEFVMLKVGGQKEMDGEMSVDPTFYRNIKEALKYEMQVGVYFYSYAKSTVEAKRQARWIISKVKDYDLTLPIVFDWENWKEFTKFNISFHTLNKIASTFMKEINDYGYDAMLYSSKYYLETIWYREDYTNWLAYYTKNNNYDGEYLMWQLCNNGKIDGIDGYVDINIMYLDNKYK